MLACVNLVDEAGADGDAEVSETVSKLERLDLKAESSFLLCLPFCASTQKSALTSDCCALLLLHTCEIEI